MLAKYLLTHLFQGAILKIEKLNLTGCKLQSTACTSSVTQTCTLPTTFCIIELYNWVRAGKAGLTGRATTILVEILKLIGIKHHQELIEHCSHQDL